MGYKKESNAKKLLHGHVAANALVVFEGKDQQPVEGGTFAKREKKVAVGKDHKGAQPTLYMVVDKHNRKEVATLLSALHSENLVSGEKQYRTLEDHPAMKKFSAYYEKHYAGYVDFLDNYGAFGVSYQANFVARNLRNNGDVPTNGEAFVLAGLIRSVGWLETQQHLTGDIKAALILPILEKVQDGSELDEYERMTLDTFLDKAQDLPLEIKSKQYEVNTAFFASLDAPSRKYFESKNIDSLGVSRIDPKDHQFYVATYDAPTIQLLGEGQAGIPLTKDAKVLRRAFTEKLEQATEINDEKRILIKVPLRNKAVQLLDLDTWRAERASDFSPKARSQERSWAEDSGAEAEAQRDAFKVLENVSKHRGGKGDEIAQAMAVHFGVGGIAQIQPQVTLPAA